MVASSRRLGGFAGSWGDAAPSVRRKKKMLEAEGVLFDAAGRVEERFVEDFGGRTKKRKRESDTSSPPPPSSSVSSKLKVSAAAARSKSKKAKPTAKQTKEAEDCALLGTLRTNILRTLRARAPGKTC